MRTVYADALYYIALLLRNDQMHDAALSIAGSLGGDLVVTSEPILVEVLAHVSGLGPTARARAVALVDALRDDAMNVSARGTTIIPQTPELFEDGLALYRGRLDKGYSLTDCMSMSICRRFAVTDVLTHDRHFEQEGFAILL